MNNFVKRTITALLFAVIMMGSIVLGQNVFSFLLFIIAVLSIKEFVGLIKSDIVQPALWPTLIAGGVTFLALAAHAMQLLDSIWLVVVIPFLFLIFMVELWRNKANPFINISVSLAAILYISLPLGLMMYFFNPNQLSGPSHYGIVLGFLIILWVNDTGAYLIGSAIGRHKLFERISPGKTWEGSIGGAITAMLAAWVLSMLFSQLPVAHWLVISLIIVITGTLGDLIESMLKRSLGVKDSGKILPGHGGMLDRFDAVFLSAPFVFVYLTLLCR